MSTLFDTCIRSSFVDEGSSTMIAHYMNGGEYERTEQVSFATIGQNRIMTFPFVINSFESAHTSNYTYYFAISGYDTGDTGELNCYILLKHYNTTTTYVQALVNSNTGSNTLVNHNTILWAEFVFTKTSSTQWTGTVNVWTDSNKTTLVSTATATVSETSTMIKFAARDLWRQDRTSSGDSITFTLGTVLHANRMVVPKTCIVAPSLNTVYLDSLDIDGLDYISRLEQTDLTRDYITSYQLPFMETKANIDGHRSDYTSTRAGKIDNLDMNIGSRGSLANQTSLISSLGLKLPTSVFSGWATAGRGTLIDTIANLLTNAAFIAWATAARGGYIDDIPNIHTHLHDIDTALSNIEDKIDIIDGIIDDIKVTNDNLTTSVATIDGIVDDIKITNDNMTTNLQTVDDNVDSVKTTVEGTATQVATVDEAVAAVAAAIVAVQADLTAYLNPLHDLFIGLNTELLTPLITAFFDLLDLEVTMDDQWDIKAVVETMVNSLIETSDEEEDIHIKFLFTKSEWSIDTIQALINDPPKHIEVTFMGSRAWGFYFLPFVPFPIPDFLADKILDGSDLWDYGLTEKSESTILELVLDAGMIASILVTLYLVATYAPSLLGTVIGIFGNLFVKLFLKLKGSKMKDVINLISAEVGVEEGTDTLNQKMNAMVNYTYAVLDYLMDPMGTERPDPADYNVYKDVEP